MAGLLYLKHAYDLSDEAVCERWPANERSCGPDADTDAVLPRIIAHVEAASSV